MRLPTGFSAHLRGWLFCRLFFVGLVILCCDEVAVYAETAGKANAPYSISAEQPAQKSRRRKTKAKRKKRQSRLVYISPHVPIPTMYIELSSDVALIDCKKDAASDFQSSCHPDLLVKVSVLYVNIDPKIAIFRYEASVGQIEGSGDEVIWNLSGVKPGVYRLTAYIDDGHQHEVSTFASITVSECGDCAPVP